MPTLPTTVPPPASSSISEPGDIWRMGAHRVICADAQTAASYRQLMQGKLAQAVFTDVPYNLAGGTISGKGKVRHGSFKMAAGEMSAERYRAFLHAVWPRWPSTVPMAPCTTIASTGATR